MGDDFPKAWERRVQALMRQFPDASRDGIQAALLNHGGLEHAAARDLCKPANAGKIKAAQRAEAEWAQRARSGGRCFTDGRTFTPWGAECVADAMKTLGKTVEFASQWDGRSVYSWSSKHGQIEKQYESVHGGPRIGEPGCEELVSVAEFCAQVASDHDDHHNTFAKKTESWFGDIP